MSYLKILNLQFNRYRLTTTIEDNTIYGFYCPNEEDRLEFFKLIAGINDNSNSIFYCDLEFVDHNVFDNQEYFEKRLYIDFKHKYLKTLNANAISEMFKIRFNKEFNIASYKEAVSSSNIRSEVLLSNEYQFTPLGITLSSYCLFKGLNYQYNFIDNPVVNIKNNDLKKKIYENICKKELNPIIGFDKLTDCKDYCDKIIVAGEYQDIVVIDVKNDSFIVSNDNQILRNKLFNVNEMVISINTYTKEELKYFSKNKVKYKIVTLNDIIKLLGGNDEK